MRKVLGFLLSLSILSVFVFSSCNQGGSSSSDGPVEPNQPTVKTIELNMDKLPVLKGSSYEIDLITYADNQILSGVTYEYESKDTSVATVVNGVLSGVNFGETKIIVTVKYEGEIIATKELQCKVNDNNAMYTNKSVYELYTMDKVLGTTFKTEESVLTTMYVDGEEVVDYGNITWTSGDPSIATIDGKGKITAVSAGETYVVGSYRYQDKVISTRKVPVKISKPYLSTNIDVLFDKNLGTGLFESAKVLGKGYSVGKVVDIETNKEYAINHNTIDLNKLSVGDYRFVVYEENELFSTEVNVIVSDYIINDIDEFKAGEWYSCSYVVLNTDLTNVGKYKIISEAPDFEGTFNGMGHKITGISYGYNNHGIFATVRNATIKNLAVKCTILKGKAGQGGLFYRSIGVMIDNVYVETVFEESVDHCGGLCDVAINSLTIKNTIIKTFNATDSSKCGAIMARTSILTIPLENVYCISALKLCSEGSYSSNTRHSFINNQSNGKLFDTNEEFDSAEEKGTLSFDGFNHYWNLNGSIPVFKTLK